MNDEQGPNPPAPARAAPAPEGGGAVGAGEVATARPWSYDESGHLFGSDEIPVGEWRKGAGTMEEQHARILADRALIVRAVNSHGELIECLKLFTLHGFSVADVQKRVDPGTLKNIMRSRLAIARAEGERGE